MDEFITVDLILSWLKKQVEEKVPISPQVWLDACMKLNILKSDENDKCIEMKHQLAMKRAIYVKEGGTSAAANIMLEADPFYKEVKKQEAKLKTVEEAIRLGKLTARIKSEELRNSL